MKKKILLFISLVSALLCIFAISVSAEKITYNGNEIEITRGHTRESLLADETVFNDFASKLLNGSLKSDLTTILDDSSYAVIMGDNQELYAVPSYYLIQLSDYGDDSRGAYIAVSEINYSYVDELITETTFQKGAIRYIAFPEGMTRIRNNTVFGQKNGSDAPYEINVTDVVFPSTIVAIEGESFKSAPSLKNVYVKPGNQIKEIPSGTFSGSTIQYLQFENLTELETINGFTNTKLTGDLDLSKTKLKTIKNTCFQASQNIGKITLPDTVEVIEDAAFENCGAAYLSSPYLPSSLTSVGKRFFSYNTNLNETYIFPEGVTSLGDEAFEGSRRGGGATGKSLNLVFLGKVTGVIYLNGGGHQKHAEHVNVFFAQNTLSEYNTNGFYIKPSNSSTTSIPGAIRAIYCSGNGVVELSYITSTDGKSFTADMANDETNGFDMANHMEITPAEISCGNPLKCIVCDILQTVDHTRGELTKITYSNGYSNVGDKTFACSVCGQDVLGSGEAEAIFTASGYSIKESTGTGLLGSFVINRVALNLYNEYAEAPLVYGVVMSNANIENGGLTFNSNNVLTSANGIQLKVADEDVNYAKINYTIDDFSIHDEKTSTLELVITLYVVDENGISFIQGNSSSSETTATIQGGTVALKAITFKKVAELTGVYDKLIEATKIEAEIKE